MWSRLARRRARPFPRRLGSLPPGVIAARVNGELRDLAYLLTDGDVVEPVDIASDDGRYIVRHSAAHVMAQAVQDLFPQAKLGIGPPWRTGSTTTSTSRRRSPRRT
jgi:threonyl-tRNA synthetase